MKKQIIIGIIIIVISVLLINIITKSNEKPDEGQIKAICELSTLNCYYNNVAKIKKEKGEGLLHIFEKEREIWIEYEAIAKIGINVDGVSMKLKKDIVEITMPKAIIVDIEINRDSFNEDCYTISKDGFINKNKITAEEQQNAIVKAQENLEKTIQENNSLFEKAEKRAKELIENYINKLGDVLEKKYTIEWKNV